MNRHPLYVTDTHSLLWYLYDIPRLGPEARAAFETINREDAVFLILRHLITRDEAIRQAGVVECVW